jgi:3-dehydroquinate synthase
MTGEKRLVVELGDRRYPIQIGRGVLTGPGWIESLGARPRVLLTDATVDSLYGAQVRAALGIEPGAVFVLQPGEAAKSIDTAARVWTWLAERRLTRDGVIIALGGGVVGDLAGFVAATWMRGVDFVQLPTTLLAMVDSSVGGKTAVNLPAGKNLIGAFHQPLAVAADLATLDTLPVREYASGLAETLKYGAIVDPAFFGWIEAHSGQLLARKEDALATAVHTSCAHKAAIVARDERETGERAWLNFGHTFGHAIEAAGGFRDLLHGESIAIGMVLAARLSARLGLASVDDAERIERALNALGLATAIPESMDADDLLERMRLDKKSVGGRMRLVLWRGVGRAEIVDGVADQEIHRVLLGALPDR